MNRKTLPWLLVALLTGALCMSYTAGRNRGYREGYQDGLDYRPPMMRYIDSLEATYDTTNK